MHMTKWMTRALGGAAVLASVLASSAATAGAKPLERERYSFQDSDTFTDTECGDPITIDYAAEFSGLFMLKQGRAGDPTPYLFDNYSGVETYTNVANGETFTLVHQGLFKDQRIELVGHHLPVHRHRDRSARLRDRARRDEGQPGQGPHPLHVLRRHAGRFRPGQRRVPRRSGA
jgi:hypothetical protein